MRQTRPYFLELWRIRLPIGGWVSILHRASGALLALAVPVLLYAGMLSLRSAEDYARLTAFLGGGIGLFLTLGLAWFGLHHFLAGLRHLGFDMGLGKDKHLARQSAWAALSLALVFTGLLGLWAA